MPVMIIGTPQKHMMTVKTMATIEPVATSSPVVSPLPWPRPAPFAIVTVGSKTTVTLVVPNKCNRFKIFYFSRSSRIQPAKLERLKRRSYGSEMLQYEADGFIGGDIPETLVGVFIFCVSNLNFNGNDNE